MTNAHVESLNLVPSSPDFRSVITGGQPSGKSSCEVPHYT